MRTGAMRAEEYAGVLIARAAANTRLNAFLAYEPQAVLEAARDADARRARGGKLGALHGLPLPVKDSVNTRALVTTNGTRALRGFRPKDDAEVMHRLFAQGAILFGKTNLHELSRGWTSNNGAFGAVRNAYDPQHVPGGSSGGSATLVAARVAPLAVAEDTWGSIRIPAAWCGTVGFRPTVGRYPNDGIIPLTRGRFDQVGPVARSVADVALFDHALTGEPIAQTVALAGRRLGVPLQWLEGLDPELARLTQRALDAFVDAGAILVHLPLPSLALESADLASTIIACENVAAIEGFLRDEGAGMTFAEVISQASPNLRARYEDSPPDRADHARALGRREELIAQMRDFFREQRLEALVFPPVLAPAPPLGDNAEIVVAGEMVPIRTVVGRNTALGNCARLASLVVPVGLTQSGLPVALELDAASGKDRELLALGLAVESVLGPLPAPPSVRDRLAASSEA
ncbi:MAG TPA: amidase family protein [Usitatibacter sp.]|nr:amidase family protein [Usitatibacter sp.]